MGCLKITYRNETESPFLGVWKRGEGEKELKDPYDYGFRIYNPALGRFLSVDPLAKSYPFYTPYQYAGNKPVWAVDMDGLEDAIYTIVDDLNGNKKESLVELSHVGKLGPGIIINTFGYHGNLNDPGRSLEETLDRTQLLNSYFLPTLFITGGECKFDSALELNFSLEFGPNATARGRILGFGGGSEVGVTGEVGKFGVQLDSRLDDIRINPNSGVQAPNLSATLGGDAAIFSGTAKTTFSFDDDPFSPKVKDTEIEGSASVLKLKTQSSKRNSLFGKIELASFAVGAGLIKLKGSLSSPEFDLMKGELKIRKRFDPNDVKTVPADNVRVGSGEGF